MGAERRVEVKGACEPREEVGEEVGACKVIQRSEGCEWCNSGKSYGSCKLCKLCKPYKPCEYGCGSEFGGRHLRISESAGSGGGDGDKSAEEGITSENRMIHSCGQCRRSCGILK